MCMRRVPQHGWNTWFQVVRSLAVVCRRPSLHPSFKVACLVVFCIVFPLLLDGRVVLEIVEGYLASWRLPLSLLVERLLVNETVRFSAGVFQLPFLFTYFSGGCVNHGNPGRKKNSTWVPLHTPPTLHSWCWFLCVCVCVLGGGGGGEGRREYFNCVDFVVWFTVAAELVSKPTFCWDLHFTSDGILDNDAITYHLSLLFA